MQPQETTYVALNDGRKLCLECLDSAIMDTKECLPLYADIQRFYEGLNMKLDQPIPLLLVERQALNEAREGEKNVRKIAFTLFCSKRIPNSLVIKAFSCLVMQVTGVQVSGIVHAKI